ncbi:hypothetical protein CK627_20890 [Aeromonas dhakensis]|uniref:hypothetical protein n=1 Tax=Aeromonas dhakensis TaxID=196024 RepID=UPI000BAAC303|nr:hypothetical protein [Aeromonas dhakensis]ASX13066.1 hypothetical protein CK627_20890 [Aeromonas dhakensis]
MVASMVLFAMAIAITNFFVYKITKANTKRECSMKISRHSIECSTMMMENSKQYQNAFDKLKDCALKNIELESKRADMWHEQWELSTLQYSLASRGVSCALEVITQVNRLQMEREQKIELLCGIYNDPTGLTAEMYGINLEKNK